MAVNGKKRKGGRRPVKFVEHPDTGEPIVDLRHKTDGRFYRIEDGKRHFYAPNGRKGLDYLRRSIYEHECWRQGREPTDVTRIEINHPQYNEFGDVYAPSILTSIDDPTRRLQISKEDLANYFRDQMSNPLTRVAFADMVGIPELVNVHTLPSVAVTAPSPTLDAIYKQYERKSDETVEHRNACLAKWDQFRQIVKRKTIAEIEFTDVENYRDAIHQCRKDGKHTVTYVRSAFNNVKHVLRYAADQRKDKSDFADPLAWFNQLLKRPKKPTKGPEKDKKYQLTRKEFQALYDVAVVKWKAILAVAMNSASKPTEIQSLRKDECNLNDGTITGHRHKTGRPFVVMLAPLTVDALNAYWHSEPHDCETVFANAHNSNGNIVYRPFGKSYLRHNFPTLRSKAGISHAIQFQHIRDSAATISAKADPGHTPYLLGHSTGQKDNYVIEHPEFVTECCQAIADHYFNGRLP